MHCCSAFVQSSAVAPGQELVNTGQAALDRWASVKGEGWMSLSPRSVSLSEILLGSHKMQGQNMFAVSPPIT